jgi:hypothetical protein
VIVTGRTVADAFTDLYYLECAARAQVLAASGGHRLRTLPEEVQRRTAEQYQQEFPAFPRGSSVPTAACSTARSRSTTTRGRSQDREQGPAGGTPGRWKLGATRVSRPATQELRSLIVR